MMRDLARTTALPAYSAAGGEDGLEILRDLSKKLDWLDPSVEKVRLEVAMTRAYYARKHADSGDALVERALSTGSATFRRQLLADPGKLSYTIGGIQELLEASETVGSKASKPRGFVKAIEDFQPDVMQARLVVKFARRFRNAFRTAHPHPE